MSRVLRREFSRVSVLDDLRRVLAKGDDAKGNVLVLDIDAIFQFFAMSWVIDYESDHSVAVFGEMFLPDSDCVGVLACRDVGFVYSVFMPM